MDDVFLVILMVLVTLVLGIVLGIVAIVKSNRNSRELKLLATQIADLKSSWRTTSPIHTTPEVDPVATTKQDQNFDQVIAAENTQPDIQSDPQTPLETPPQETLPLVDDEVQPAAQPPARSFEETIGSLWAVWVGGIALALGAVFLVKYSIERDLLSPFVRIMAGAGFSGMLIFVAEWARRKGDEFSFTAFDKANIPAILTAAGTMGLFASTFAAYAIYDMITPFFTFLILGSVAVATTFAALLHGPLLAGLGMLASYLVPPIVSTSSSQPVALAAYVVTVSLAGFAVGRIRRWKWLATMIATGLIIYSVVLLSMGASTDRLVVLIYFIISWSLIAYVFFISLFQRLSFNLEKLDKTAIVLLSGLLFLLVAGLQFNSLDNVAMISMFFALVAPFWLALYYSASRAIVYSSMAAVFVGYLAWNIDFFIIPGMSENLTDVPSLLTHFQIRDQLSTYHSVGMFLAIIALATSFWAIIKSASRASLAIGGAFLPLLLLSANYLRVEEFSSSLGYGFISLVLFAGYLFASNYIFLKLDKSATGRDEASAAYAVAAFLALALAAGFVLEKAALTIALGLLVPAISFVNWRRPLPALRALSVLAAGLWIARIIWSPEIISGPLGNVPIFNWLTYGYGIPTAGFAAACWMLGMTRRDKWLEFLEAITLASFVATLSLVFLHAISPSQVFTQIDTLEEVALMTLIGGGVALGIGVIKRTQSSYVMKNAVTLLGYLGMLSALIGLVVIYNPWISGEAIGPGIFFNILLFSYFATGALYLALGWYMRGKRSATYVNIAYICGAVLLFSWINLSIRHIYHPGGLHLAPTYQSELYTYSIIWLLISIGLLAAGIILRLKKIRLVSVGLLVAVVAKVFLIDMAELEGILRAFSFIGLGATLIGIGLVYQRVLSKPDNEPARAP